MTCDHLAIRLRDGARVNVKSGFPLVKRNRKGSFTGASIHFGDYCSAYTV